jgi:lactate permease
MATHAALAFAPIALILALMLGARWSAARAGLAGLALTLVIALAAFGYGGGARFEAIAGALLEAGFIAATILWIIFPALCIHELQVGSGRLGILQRAIDRLSPDPRIKAILIGWFLALFLEGAAGFGTPIALTAPILVSVGFSPVQALSIALVGHAAGVSFGALGTPILPQVAATSLSGEAIGRGTAQLHALLGWLLLALMVRLARVGSQEWETSSIWGWAALAGAVFLLPSWLLARFVGPELPTLGGALIGATLFAALLHVRRNVGTGAVVAGDDRASDLLRASLPYLVLLGLILATRLIEPLRVILQEVAISWRLFARFEGSIAPLYHPGSMLLLGFLLGGLAQGARPRARAGRGARSQAAGARSCRAVRHALPVTLDGARRHDRGAGRGRSRRTRYRLAAGCPLGGRPWHLYYRLGDRLQHPLHRFPAGDCPGARPAGSEPHQRPGLRRRGRQHRLPPQHYRGGRHGGRDREGGRGAPPHCSGLRPICHGWRVARLAPDRREPALRPQVLLR